MEERPQLSAKAKGKQKAIVQEDDDVNCAYVNIRFTSGDLDLLGLPVRPDLTVRDFKKEIVAARPALAEKRLRLIYLGRVLTDGIILYPWLESLLERQAKQQHETSSLLAAAQAGMSQVVKVTSSLSRPADKDRDQETLPTTHNPDKRPGKSPQTAVWLNCSVSDALPSLKRDTATPLPGPETENADQAPDADTDADTVAETSAPVPAVPPRLTGFDRLREAGFTEEEVNEMRAQFQLHHSDDVHQEEHGPVVDDEDEHARALEDQWMEGLGNQEMSMGEQTGRNEYTVLFKGLCLGFFFPIVPIFFFKTHLFSRRTQMGIVAGTLINLCFGILRHFS